MDPLSDRPRRSPIATAAAALVGFDPRRLSVVINRARTHRYRTHNNGFGVGSLERSMTRPSTRRRFLALSSSAAIAGIAGCTDQLGLASSDDSPGGDPNGSTSGGVPSLETESLSRETYSQPGESFEDFEDLSAWSVVQGSGEPDTEVVFDGSQSFRLNATGDRNVVVERELDEDLTDRDFSFAMRTTTPGNVAVYLRLVDAYGSHTIYQLRQITYRTPDVGWFRTNPGVFETTPVPTEMGDLERMELVVLNTGPEADVWIDDLRTHAKPDKGYVVLSWDDGRRDYYDDAAPMHDEYGVPAIQAPIPDTTSDGNTDGRYMTVQELQERQDAGDEIVVHGTHEPIHRYDEAEIEPRLRRDKQWFIDNGFEGADYIVYPHNSFDETSLEYTDRYHDCGGFNQSGDVNTTGVYGFDPLVLPRTIGWDLDISKRCVDRAAEHNNCTILNFHAFDEKNTMSKEQYGQLLEHIDAKGDDLEVITLGDLWQLRTSEQ